MILDPVTKSLLRFYLPEHFQKDIDRATAAAIERIARRFEPALRDGFLAAVRSARDNATLETIANAIRSLNPAAAIRTAVAGLEFDEMRDTLADIIQAAGDRVTSQMRKDLGASPEGHILAGFDITNPYAANYAAREVGARIREITGTTREGIQKVITSSIVDGLPPGEAAAKIKGMIGLTEYQTNIALNYESRLLSEGADNIDNEVQAYADKLLGQRAITIARHESLDSANTGQQIAWRAAQDQGFLDKDVEQVWIVTRDDRLCPICKPMPNLPENQHVKIGGVFTTGDGRTVTRPPQTHVACRCAVSLRLR